MSDNTRIQLAEELEERAKQLRKEAVRKLPNTWRVGQKIRYINSSDLAWNRGETAYVLKLRDEYKTIQPINIRFLHRPERRKCYFFGQHRTMLN